MWKTSAILSNTEDNTDEACLWSLLLVFDSFYPISLCQILSFPLSISDHMKLCKYQVYLYVFFNLICLSESGTQCLTRSLLLRFTVRREVLKLSIMDLLHPRILLARAGSALNSDRVAWGFVWSSLENLQGWRFHNLIWKPSWNLLSEGSLCWSSRK